MMGKGDPRLDPPPGLLARLLVSLARRLLPLEGRLPAANDLRRVLVVRPDDRVGNALLTIPLARTLTRLLPHARVDVLLAARRACVAEGLPGIGVVKFDKRDAFLRPLRFLRFLLELRRAGYDAAIDASHWHSFSLTAALLTRLGTRRWTVGSARGPREIYSAAIAPPPPGMSELRGKLLLAGGLSLAAPEEGGLETSLGTAAAALAWAQGELKRCGLGPGFAMLNPGARKADHRSPTHLFAEIALELQAAHGLRSLVVFGPGEEDLARAVCGEAGAAAVLAPPTDLDRLAALLRASSLFVTNDTGPLHLGVACGARVISLGLSADAERWAHPGSRFRLVRSADDGAIVPRILEAAGALLSLTEPGPQGTLSPPREDA